MNHHPFGEPAFCLIEKKTRKGKLLAMGGTEISREISAMEISMEFPKFPRAKIHFP